MNFKAAIPTIIVINVILFAAWNLLPQLQAPMFTTLALYFPQNENFGVWQFFTNMFMHGGFAHILFNMYALWAFGSPLELLWGKKRFLFFYFLCGIGAGVIYILVNYLQFNAIYQELRAAGIDEQQIVQLLRTGNYNPQTFADFSTERLQTFYQLFTIPAVGASGAIYGVLVAFGILFPNSKLMLLFLPFPIAAKYFIPALIAIDLFSGLTGVSIFGGGIAHFAHVGGALIGFLLMWHWRKRIVRRPRPFDDPPVV